MDVKSTQQQIKGLVVGVNVENTTKHELFKNCNNFSHEKKVREKRVTA